jgi:hypothetical protein
MSEPTTGAGRTLHGGHCRYPEVCTILAAILAIEDEAAAAAIQRAEQAEAEVVRLRQQNHDAAAARDRQTADLQRRIAEYDNAAVRARELVRGTPVDWSYDPPSREPDGWWKYTSVSVKHVLITAVHDAQARAALAGTPAPAETPDIDVERLADLFMDLRLNGPAALADGWTYQQTARYYAGIICRALATPDTDR